MSKAGDVFENPITGEYGYIRLGTQETSGQLIVSDLRVRPGGAVIGAHIHPTVNERFTVLEVVVFLNPPPAIQRIVFSVLAPLGRMLGYKAIYPHHMERPVRSVPVDPLPEWVVAPKV
jgi:hypothetical protein